MRAIYWVNDQLHSVVVRVGDWALKKPLRPLFLSVFVSVLMASLLFSLLCLAELASGRR